MPNLRTCTQRMFGRKNTAKVKRWCPWSIEHVIARKVDPKRSKIETGNRKYHTRLRSAVTGRDEKKQARCSLSISLVVVIEHPHAVTEFLKTRGNSRRHEIDSFQGKLKACELLRKKFLQSCGRRQNEIARSPHTNDGLSSGETLYMFQCRVSCNGFLWCRQPKIPEQSRKWATWAAFHFLEAGDDRMWVSPGGRRSSSKLPKQFRWGLTMVRGNTAFSLLGRLPVPSIMNVNSGNSDLSMATATWTEKYRFSVCCWDCCLEEWRRQIWWIWQCYR